MKHKSLLLAPAFALLLAACGTLDTNGPYKADSTLYAADSTYQTVYTAVDSALKWELANDATVSASVKAAANQMRTQFPKAALAYSAARSAYVVNANAGTQASLQAALNDLNALAQAVTAWFPK